MRDWASASRPRPSLLSGIPGRHTWPRTTSGFPRATRTPNPKNDGTHVLKAPEFNWDFTLNGHVTAHIELTITFCIDEDDALQSLSKRPEIYGPLVPRVSGPAVSGQPRPPCLLCGSDSGLGKRDGERCSYEPIANPTCPANSSLTRRLEDLGLYDDVHGVFNIPDPELAGHLEKRKPEEKVLTWTATPGQSRSAMRPLRNMLHRGRGKSVYVTEHVYEAHLLTRFTELLIDGNNGALPAGHTKASRQWVSEADRDRRQPAQKSGAERLQPVL
ncbi:hypothetical protein ACKVWC_009142 [Pyricularia oryzae]